MRTLKLLFLVIVLLFSVSVGYSKLQQKLSVYSTVTLMPQPEEQNDNYSLTYTLEKKWGNGPYYYKYSMSLQYLGTDPDITSWALILDVPKTTDVEDFWNCECSLAYRKLTIYNVSRNFSHDNGSISKLTNKKATFGIILKMSKNNYQPTNHEAHFYNLTDSSKRNPYLETNVDFPINSGGAFTLTKEGDYPQDDGKIKRHYRLALKNTTSNILYEFTAILNSFDLTKMQLLGAESFGDYITNGVNLKYTTNNNELTLKGTNLGNNKTLSLDFYVKYLTANTPAPAKGSFTGRRL